MLLLGGEAVWHMVKNIEAAAHMAWVDILVLPLSSCVTWGPLSPSVDKKTH